MTQNSHIKHNSHDCISQEEMKAYLNGTLSSEEMHRIESHTLDCEMCNDELEGLSLLNSPNDITAITADLNKQILAKTQTKKVIAFPIKRFMAAAASIVLILGIGYISIDIYNQDAQEENLITQSSELENIQEKVEKQIKESQEESAPIPNESHQEKGEEAKVLTTNENELIFDMEDEVTIEMEAKGLLNFSPTAEPEVIEEYTMEADMENNIVYINSSKEQTSAQFKAEKPLAVAPESIHIEKNKSVIATPNSRKANIAKKKSLSDKSIAMSGKILDARNDQPIIGAAINVKNSKNGTYTYDGNFELHVAPGENIIEVSMMGYKTIIDTVYISANSENEYVYKPEIDATVLDAIVVTGLSTAKLEDVAGNQSSITSKDFDDKPFTGVDEAIQGKAAGVTVASNSGSPGEGMNIVVGGLGTTGDARPLWIVDGVPIGTEYKGDPSNIKNLVIIKDASSLAQYGARGANGVILVTTYNSASTSFVKPKYKLGTKTDFEKSIVSQLQTKFPQNSETITVYTKITATNKIQFESSTAKSAALEQALKTILEETTQWNAAKNNEKAITSPMIFTFDLSQK